MEKEIISSFLLAKMYLSLCLKTFGEHLTMAVSANMFYIAIDFKNKKNMKVAASNINIIQLKIVEKLAIALRKISVDLTRRPCL